MNRYSDFSITGEWHAKRWDATGFKRKLHVPGWGAYWPDPSGFGWIALVFQGTQQECHDYIIARRLLDGLSREGCPDNG